MNSEMHCKFGELLKAWLDGELDARRAAEVELHTASCEACKEIAEDYRRISRCLNAVSQDVPPPATARILERTRLLGREEERVIRTLQRVAALAAAVLILSVGTLVLLNGTSPEFGASGRDNVMEIVLREPHWGEDI